MNKLTNKDLNIIKTVLDKYENSNYQNYKVEYFNEGTNSKVFLLNNKYIIKQNSEEIIKSEILFSENNKHPLLQKLLFYDENHKYIIYKYIEGINLNNFSNINIKLLIESLLDIVNSYKKTDIDFYGYINSPKKSWEEFLKEEISDCEYSYKSIKNFDIEKECLIISKYKFEKKIIHGDFGAHNFLTKNNKLSGVIDPETIIGDSLYDILFAICSNPNILNYFCELNTIFKIINEPQEKIISLLKIILFSRITRAYHHHKKDVDFYINFYIKAFKI